MMFVHVIITFRNDPQDIYYMDVGGMTKLECLQELFNDIDTRLPQLIKISIAKIDDVDWFIEPVIQYYFNPDVNNDAITHSNRRIADAYISSRDIALLAGLA